MQCASVGSSCSTARGRDHMVMRSRALCLCVGACTVLFMYESQYLSTVLAPQGFFTSVYVCTVPTLKGFIQSAGARPPGLCTSVYFSTARAQTGFVRCEPARALYSVLVLAHQSFYPVLMCSCGSVRSEPARACASVRDTSPKSFVRCKPTKALYSVLVLAPGLCTPCSCARAVV